MTLRSIVAALLAGALAAAPATAQDPLESPESTGPSFSGLIMKARKALDARKFDRARDLYRRALALRPESIEARRGQAGAEDDHFWYGRRPVEFRIHAGDWQRIARSRTGNPVLRALDPRLITWVRDTGEFDAHLLEGSTKTDRQNISRLRGLKGGAGGVLPGGRSSPRNFDPIVTVRPDGRKPRGSGPSSIFKNQYTPTAPKSGRDRTYEPRAPGSTRDPVRGSPRERVGDVGIAAAMLGFMLPVVYEYAVPLDLTLEPLGSSRAAGFSALFGFAPMRGAAVLGSGVWKVGLTYSNWFGTMDKEGQYITTAPIGQQAPVPTTGSFYRYRGNRYDEGLINVDVGIAGMFELSMGLSIASLKEGHSGKDRNKITFNRDGYVHVAEISRQANIGNATVGIRWGTTWGGEGDLFSGIGAALDVKIPLGDPDDFVTSGTIDFALTAILTQVVIDGDRPLYLHLNVGAMLPIGDDEFFQHPPVAASAPAPPLDDEVDPRLALFAGLGISWKVSRHLVFLVSFEGNASPYDAGDNGPDGLGDGSFGAADGLTFTGHLGMRVLFDKLAFEGSFGQDLMVGDVRGMTGRISVALFFGGKSEPSRPGLSGTTLPR